MVEPCWVERYGPWALVAGGSEGIGRAFAEALAARGLNVAIAALPDGPLDAASRDIARRFGVQTLAVPLDLAQPDRIQALDAALGERLVGLLVCAAAYNPVGPWLERTPEQLTRVLDVNCRAPLALCHHFGSAMAQRRRGGVVVVSSMSALTGAPRVAAYAASKAYDLILAEGLWDELREADVHVLAVVPGLTDTPGLAASSPRLGRLARRSLTSPEHVAERAIDALGKRMRVTPGGVNRVAAHVLGRLVPRAWAVRVVGRQMRGMYP